MDGGRFGRCEEIKGEFAIEDGGETGKHGDEDADVKNV